MFSWTDQENLADAAVVVPLLEELFFVGCWVAFDEILKLWKVRSQKYSPNHDGRKRDRYTWLEKKYNIIKKSS